MKDFIVRLDNNELSVLCTYIEYVLYVTSSIEIGEIEEESYLKRINGYANDMQKALVKDIGALEEPSITPIAVFYASEIITTRTIVGNDDEVETAFELNYKGKYLMTVTIKGSSELVYWLTLKTRDYLRSNAIKDDFF